MRCEGSEGSERSERSEESEGGEGGEECEEGEKVRKVLVCRYVGELNLPIKVEFSWVRIVVVCYNTKLFDTDRTSECDGVHMFCEGRV